MPIIDEIRRAKELGYAGHDKHIWQACLNCGLEHWVRLVKNNPKNLYCISCSAKLNRGTGGKRKDGYILIRLPVDDFFWPMAKADGYIYQHRLIVAQSLGRCLQPWEIVHHRNSIRADNRLGNLQLISELGHKQLTALEHKVQEQAKEITQLRQYIRELENENRRHSPAVCRELNEFT